jgi:branched-chain amino acid transport system ATP-binding protein
MSVVLACAALDAGYSGSPVVRSFDMEVNSGDVLALLGPNGAGKTTVLLTMAGLLRRMGGSVDIMGKAAPNGEPNAATRRGLVLVPDDRSLFRGLTCRDNIVLGQRRGGATVDDMLDFFPALRDRLEVKAGSLSGGEQQMLAMARGLVQDPKVLLIDELSMGLAPIIVERLLPVLRQIADQKGIGVVLVEQHIHLALEVANRAVVLVHGDIALAAPTSELRSDMSVIERAYLGTVATD